MKMVKNLMVTLVSDQTIPNIQLIKEFSNENSDFLFVTTVGMEQKGCRNWIENAANIKEDRSFLIEVDQFSFSDISEKFNNFDFDVYDKVIVNLTGGTKVMTLTAFDFFKNQGSDIYYVTGNEEKYIKVFPRKKSNQFKLKSKITLLDYLTAYGFKYVSSKLSGISFEQSKKIFNAFSKPDLSGYDNAILFINSKRKMKISSEEYNANRIEDYLNFIDYKPNEEGVLNEKETQYLSGEWFEEYIGLTIKQELGLDDRDISISIKLTKTVTKKPLNSIRTLLGEGTDADDHSKSDPENEMDVLFVYNNRFYSIECKSSIIASRQVMKNGAQMNKPYNILGETIYKSDSLRNKFGLYAQTSIVTLSDFKSYCASEDKGQRNNRINEMREYINRANLSNIKLIDKGMLCSGQTLFNLIK
ncbi:MAG: DUF1887 family CARF protein [Bacteroidaceae bacterium]